MRKEEGNQEGNRWLMKQRGYVSGGKPVRIPWEAGGVYIPPFKLAQMMKEQSGDKADEANQN